MRWCAPAISTTRTLKLLSRLHGVTLFGNRSKQAKRDCEYGLVAEKRKRKKRSAEEGEGRKEGRVTVWKDGKRREQNSMFPPQNKVGCRNYASHFLLATWREMQRLTHQNEIMPGICWLKSPQKGFLQEWVFPDPRRLGSWGMRDHPVFIPRFWKPSNQRQQWGAMVLCCELGLRRSCHMKGSMQWAEEQTQSVNVIFQAA